MLQQDQVLEKCVEAVTAEESVLFKTGAATHDIHVFDMFIMAITRSRCGTPSGGVEDRSMAIWSKVMRQLVHVMAEARGATLVDYITEWEASIRHWLDYLMNRKATNEQESVRPLTAEQQAAAIHTMEAMLRCCTQANRLREKRRPVVFKDLVEKLNLALVAVKKCSQTPDPWQALLKELEEEEAAAGLAAAAAEQTRERNRAKKARRREREAAEAALRTERVSAARRAGQAELGNASPAAAGEKQGARDPRLRSATGGGMDSQLLPQVGAARAGPSPTEPSNLSAALTSGSSCSLGTTDAGPSRSAGWTGGAGAPFTTDAAATVSGSHREVAVAMIGADGTTASVAGLLELSALNEDVEDEEDAELNALMVQLMQPSEPCPAAASAPLRVAAAFQPDASAALGDDTDSGSAQQSSPLAVPRRAQAVESYLLCSLTQVRLVDPVIAADGQTYERAAMERWLAEQPPGQQLCSPVTGQAMSHAYLLPNLAVRSLLQDA